MKNTKTHLPSALGCLQFDVQLGALESNMATILSGLEELAPAAGTLVVLPELWSSGFDYKKLAYHAEQSERILQRLVEEARSRQLFIAGSLPEAATAETGEIFYNTLYFVGPEGLHGMYRKQHLFAPMAEDRHFLAGRDPMPVALPWGKVGGLVCYDLRFPELAKAQVGAGAEVLVVVAQWPAVRLEQWRTLVVARAIENQSYIAACNRCGTTGKTVFGGHSLVVAPDGTILWEADTEPAVGSVSVNPEALAMRRRFNTVAPRPYSFNDHEKICDRQLLARECGRLKQLGRKIVFTNGCFDLLHPGHVAYLEEARKQGDMLVVGLNSDSSVRAIKGASRPITNQESRARVLAALGAVDRVALFDEKTPLELILTLQPDILVKGADWPIDQIVGGAEVLAAGGRVINIPIVGGYSTTGIIEQIKKRDA